MPIPTTTHYPSPRGIYPAIKRMGERTAARAALMILWLARRKSPAAGEPLRAVVEGSRCLIGPPRGIDSVACSVPPGLVNDSLICRWNNMEMDERALTHRYAQHFGPRQDLKLALRFLWAVLVTREAGRQSLPPPTINLLGVAINNSTISFADQMLATIMRIRALINPIQSDLVVDALRFRPASVCFVNAHNLNIYTKNPDYARALLSSEFILPDGMGVKLAARMTGQQLSHNLNGTDLFPIIMSSLEKIGGSVFLLGAENDVLDRAADRMSAEYPGIRIAGTRNGYFGTADEPEIVGQINRSRADVVVVGMGTPRQELWMERNAPQLRVGVILCMGGLIDFLGGKNARAPLWMRQAGLEWVYRFIQEPRRMWRRYVIGNPEFLWRVRTWNRGRLTPANRQTKGAIR